MRPISKQTAALFAISAGLAGLLLSAPVRADAPVMAPATGASNICPDSPLRLTFSEPPKLGGHGKIQIFDASNNQVVATIDATPFVPPVRGPGPMRMGRGGATTGPSTRAGSLGGEAAAGTGRPFNTGPSTRAVASTAPARKPVWYIEGLPVAIESVGGIANFKYYPIMLNGNEADIYPADGALTYGKTYYVTIDPTVFTTDPGITKTSDWKFSTKAAGPAKDAAKITVAADGSGDFCTVQGAIDSIPDNNTTPTTIFIRKGIYTELVLINGKSNLTLQGEDRKGTIVQYPNNNSFNGANDGKVYHRGSILAVRSDNLTFTNLTMRNTTPRGGSQAEAIILVGNNKTSRAVLSNVDLYSTQDTLQINGQGYINNCYIEGDVDFMWGTGPCFFENSHFNGTRPKGYYTQIRNTDANHGYVYYHCNFDTPEGIQNMYLSRIATSIFPYSEVVLIDCVLSKGIAPVGWLYQGQGEAPDINFAEYNSHDSDGKPVDVSARAAGSKQFKQPADAETIAHYSDPKWVLGGDWDPRQNANAGAMK